MTINAWWFHPEKSWSSPTEFHPTPGLSYDHGWFHLGVLGGNSTVKHIPWRIHGAAIYANVTGVYWWDPWHTIYSSTMDPMGIGNTKKDMAHEKTRKKTWNTMKNYGKNDGTTHLQLRDHHKRESKWHPSGFFLLNLFGFNLLSLGFIDCQGVKGWDRTEVVQVTLVEFYRMLNQKN